MLPAPLAIAWPVWRRHRWGFLGAAGFLGLAAVVAWGFVLIFSPRVAQNAAQLRNDFVGTFIAPVAIVTFSIFFFLIGVFSYGFDADIGDRESCFPPGLYRLPVTTLTLVAWPLLYGAVATVCLWIITAKLIIGPWVDRPLPLWWPAALAAAVIGWVQASLWAPVGLKVVRIFVIVALVTALATLAGWCAVLDKPDSFRALLFVALTACAWAAGYVGVRYARRGDILDWNVLPHREFAVGRPKDRAFASADWAQVWFEFKRNGHVLPIFACILVPFCLIGLFFPKGEGLGTPAVVYSLLVPVFVAGLAATFVSGKHSWVKDYYGVSPFTGTLPMTNGQLVGAKLKAAAFSTLITWALTGVMILSTLIATGRLYDVVEFPPRRTPEPMQWNAALVATVIAFMIWTWKRLVGSMLIGLTGRKWVINTCVTWNMTCFLVFFVVISLINNSALVLGVLPWLLGAWALFRFSASGAAIVLGLRWNLVRARTVISWIVIWLAVASSLFSVSNWISPEEVSRFYLACAVLLVMPMVELAATPLALAWNRHR